MSDRGDQGDGGEIVDGEAIVSGRDALPVLEPAEHALNDVSASISPSVQRVDNVTGSPSWNDWLDLSVDEPFSQPVGVVGFVRNEPLGRSHSLQKRERHGDVGDVAGRQGKGNDPATSIGQTMDFRRSAAA